MASFSYKGRLRRVTRESKEGDSVLSTDSGDSFSTVATSVRNRCPLSSQESTALKDVLSKRLSSAGSLDGPGSRPWRAAPASRTCRS